MAGMVKTASAEGSKKESGRNTALKSITNNVLKEILKNKIPRTRIVEYTGKNKATISRIFKGERHFSLDDLDKLSEHTDIPIGLIVMKYLQRQKSTPKHLKDAYNNLEAALKGS